MSPDNFSQLRRSVNLPAGRQVLFYKKNNKRFNMKKFILYISFLFAAFSAVAQTAADDQQMNPKKEEKIKALYVAYITQQLQLTPDEAQKFWPMHAQYDADLRAVNNNSSNELDKQQAVLNVKKKYQASFTKLLGNDRSNNFYRQDGEFRKKLVDRLKQMRQQRQGEAGMRKDGEGMKQGGGMRRRGLRN